MSAEVMQAYPLKMDPSVTGSLFSCSRTEVPCYHFCLKHSKPLKEEVEEWFMTDEEEEEDEESEMEEGEEEDEQDGELRQAGLLDQLLDEAYAHYYDEPDEWDELAHWYTTRMNNETSNTEHQSGQSSQSSGGASSGTPWEQSPQDFHPAWRPDPAGSAPQGRFSRRSEDSTETETACQQAASCGLSNRQQRQPPIGTPAGRLADPAGTSSSSRGGQRARDDPGPASSTGQPRQQQHRGQQRNRDWAELVNEQERNEAMQTSSRRQRRRNNPGWNEASLVSELELYETFNDLFFPDPESGRL